MSALLGLAGCHSAQNESSEARLDSLAFEVAELRSRALVGDLERANEESAYLTPGADGYSVVRMDIGRLTVSLANVQGYANGTRVTLLFGNPTSARIEGLSARLEWGKVDAEGAPLNDKAHLRDVTFMEALRPGAWTKMRVVLEGVPPDAFGFLRVSNVKHRAIYLFK